MPVGTKATVKSVDPRRAARARRRDPARATRTTSTSAPARRRSRELGGLHRLHGLGRADPDRLGRLPGLLAPRHDRRPRRRGRHLPLGLRRRPRALHARARGRESRPSSAPTSPCASTSARPPTPSRAELDEAVRLTTLWAQRQRRPRARPRPAAVRHRPGRHGPRAPPPLDRRDRRARLRRLRARRARDRRAAAADVRGDRRSRGASPAGPARYFMGIGDPEGILEVIERGIDMFDCVLPTRNARTGTALTWDGRLNLRNAALRPRPATARRGLRLPGLRALLARLPASPRQPARAARPPAADPA